MRRQFGGAFTAPAKALPRYESAGQGRPRHDIHVVRADVKVEPCARERHVQFVQRVLVLLGALAPAVQQLCTLVAAKAAEATAQRDELLGAWQQQDKAAAAEANQRSTAAHDGMAVFSKMQAFFTKMEAGKEASYIEHLLSEVEAACIDAQLHGVTERWLAGMAQLGDRWGDVLHTVEDVQHMAIVEQVLCTLLIQMHDPCTPPGGTTQLTWEQQERQRAAAAASTVADTNASATAACSGGLDSGSGRTLKFDAVRVPADPPLVGFEGHRQRWRELVVEGTESLVHCAQGLVDIRQVQLEDSLAMLLAKLEGALQRFHQAAPGAPQEARAELVELWMRHPGLILQILQQSMQVYVLPGLQRLEEARLLSLTLWACKAQAAVLEMSTLRGQVHTVLQAAVQGMVPAVQLQTQGKDAGCTSVAELASGVDEVASLLLARLMPRQEATAIADQVDRPIEVLIRLGLSTQEVAAAAQAGAETGVASLQHSIEQQAEQQRKLLEGQEMVLAQLSKLAHLCQQQQGGNGTSSTPLSGRTTPLGSQGDGYVLWPGNDAMLD